MVKVNNFKFCLTLLTGTLLGICIGATFLIALVSYRIDVYYREIQYLNTVIENKDIRLDKLEASLSDSKLVVLDIKVYLSSTPGLDATNDISLLEEKNSLDELDKITLETAIRDKYKQILGREVKEIDSGILGEVVNNRIMRTEHAEYKLHVNRIVLSDVLELWIEVEKLK